MGKTCFKFWLAIIFYPVFLQRLLNAILKANIPKHYLKNKKFFSLVGNFLWLVDTSEFLLRRYWASQDDIWLKDLFIHEHVSTYISESFLCGKLDVPDLLEVLQQIKRDFFEEWLFCIQIGLFFSQKHI